MSYKLLIINPGSTSTKIAVYEDEKPVFIETLRHSTEEINSYPTIYSQKDFRKNVILKVIEEKGVKLQDIDAVVGRGGLVKPLIGGTYTVNEALLKDLELGVQGQHASNLGGIIAGMIAEEFRIPAYIVDPVVVDELQEVSRLSGTPELERKSVFHALNQKAVARRYANENGKKYDDINVIVAHMGGGVSVGAHFNGRVIDVNNALIGDGPFSPERAGAVPSGDLIRLCFSGKYSEKEINKMLCGQGGVVAYLGTNDMRTAGELAEKDEKAKLVLDAFCYQVGKAIGEYAVSLKGKVEAIILTGGIAYSKNITQAISDYVQWIAPVVIYPGEDEMLALTQGGLRCLKGEEEAKIYE